MGSTEVPEAIALLLISPLPNPVTLTPNRYCSQKHYLIKLLHSDLQETTCDTFQMAFLWMGHWPARTLERVGGFHVPRRGALAISGTSIYPRLPYKHYFLGPIIRKRLGSTNVMCGTLRNKSVLTHCNFLSNIHSLSSLLNPHFNSRQ